MVSCVVAGVDGAPADLAAADWAAGLRSLSLRLLHARERQACANAPLAGPVSMRAWTARVPRDPVVALCERYPQPESPRKRSPGSPWTVLAAAVGAAEVLALGSRGLNGITGFLVGSAALAVIAAVHRPVVLVRAGKTTQNEHLPDADGLASATNGYRDVIFGLDLDRPRADLFAFDAAADRAAGLRVIHRWTLPPNVHGSGMALPDLIKTAPAERDTAALTRALRPWQLKHPDAHVHAHQTIGRAADHSVEASADACLAVVGRRIRRSAVSSHIGPVTHAVLHHSAAPVAVVAHP
ncbi:universal stress protein [Streptomyces sp. 142MFCol3.1]|uniref:universal stress protein n=1 Tax=Streptomyces sp. 142MFCol3.1 TaxID=1172179 RepID=UPI000419B4BA|nr:universal stress protein [Streptomyces sp. 142MFCol3.1]